MESVLVFCYSYGNPCWYCTTNMGIRARIFPQLWESIIVLCHTYWNVCSYRSIDMGIHADMFRHKCGSPCSCRHWCRKLCTCSAAVIRICFRILSQECDFLYVSRPNFWGHKKTRFHTSARRSSPDRNGCLLLFKECNANVSLHPVSSTQVLSRYVNSCKLQVLHRYGFPSVYGQPFQFSFSVYVCLFFGCSVEWHHFCRQRLCMVAAAVDQVTPMQRLWL